MAKEDVELKLTQLSVDELKDYRMTGKVFYYLGHICGMFAGILFVFTFAVPGWQFAISIVSLFALSYWCKIFKDFIDVVEHIMTSKDSHWNDK